MSSVRVTKQIHAAPPSALAPHPPRSPRPSSTQLPILQRLRAVTCPAEPVRDAQADVGCGQTAAARPGTLSLSTIVSQLLPRELAEARALGELYFFDPRADRAVPDPALPNDGYDTADGFYICFLRDHLKYRFELLRNLGCGSFSDVMLAYDHQLERDVAVKIIANTRAANKTARHEIAILSHLAAQGPVDHTIRMHEHFVFRRHTCVVFEHLNSGSLLDVLRLNQASTPIPVPQLRRIIGALLRCADEVHSRGVIHGDIKPENLMVVDGGAGLKMIDFGLSFMQSEPSNSHSFGTLIYSAPEVVLAGELDTALDMWSVGCMIAELATGRQLFSSKTQEEVLSKHVAALGMPPQSLLQRCKRTGLFFARTGLSGDYAAPTHTSASVPGSRALQSFLRSRAEPLLLDLVERCLRWEPRERISAAEALQHPWVTNRLHAIRYSSSTTAVYASAMPSGESALSTSPASTLQPPRSPARASTPRQRASTASARLPAVFSSRVFEF